MRKSIPIGRPSSLGRFSAAFTRLNFHRRRLDRRRLLAIAVAVMAALITQRAVSSASAAQARLGTLGPLAVATADLVPGTVLDQHHVRLEMWPVGMVPPTAIGDPNLAVGLTVRSEIQAGEPIVALRVQPGNLGLSPNEVGVTLSQPLARPPIQLGQIVQLVGVRGNDDRQIARATILGTGRVVSFTDEELTVAVDDQTMPRVLEHAAVGSVEVVITPRKG